MNSRLKDIVLNDDGSIKHLALTNGTTVEGDLYVSAMPGGWRGRVGDERELGGGGEGGGEGGGCGGGRGAGGGGVWSERTRANDAS